MKYEKFDKDGVPYIRITTPPYDCIERPMVDADEALFKEGDTSYSADEKPTAEPTPAEPYKDA